jgi:hypothetical protein
MDVCLRSKTVKGKEEKLMRTLFTLGWVSEVTC